MLYKKQITKWEERNLETKKEDYQRQLKAYEMRKELIDWAKTYTKMAAAMVLKFGEEIVLDTLEETWWNLQYEGGKTWREDFNKDADAAMNLFYDMWHKGYQGCTGSVYEVEIKDGRWDILVFNCWHQVVALELEAIGGRKIGIGWCMGDIAAVRGWCDNTVMDFPVMALRGDAYCWQIRRIVDNPDGYPVKWTKALSEKYGWRSIKELED